MRVNVDFDACDSTGFCVRIAPQVFDLDDEDMLRLLTPEPERPQWDKVRKAAQTCPKLAISVDDAG